MESGEHVAPALGARTKCQQSPEKKYNIESKTVFSTFLKICFSSSYFLGPPSEFCKSENPEKEKKEGPLPSSFLWQGEPDLSFFYFSGSWLGIDFCMSLFPPFSAPT